MIARTDFPRETGRHKTSRECELEDESVCRVRSSTRQRDYKDGAPAAVPMTQSKASKKQPTKRAMFNSPSTPPFDCVLRVHFWCFSGVPPLLLRISQYDMDVNNPAHQHCSIKLRRSAAQGCNCLVKAALTAV